MQDRAYGLLELKAIDDDRREISGIATSISADRMNDVVVPEGASFKLPIPLLSQHNSAQPIGEVYEAEVNGRNIRIKARIPKDTGLDYVENAWKQIKARLVRGLSIGFRSLKHEPLDKERPWDGFKFLEWEWLELSAVTIPANAQATIQTVKMLDNVAPAAPGQKRAQPVRLITSPGVSGSKPAVKGGIPLITRGVSK
jgi:HK97 family phage prohead protease